MTAFFKNTFPEKPTRQDLMSLWCRKLWCAFMLSHKKKQNKTQNITSILFLFFLLYYMINIFSSTPYSVILYDGHQRLSMYYKIMIKYWYTFCLNLGFAYYDRGVDLSIPLITIYYVHTVRVCGFAQEMYKTALYVMTAIKFSLKEAMNNISLEML